MRVEQDPKPALRQLREPSGYVLVLGHEQSRSALHDGHVAAERVEHVAQFGGDIPAADHYEGRGNLFDAHDGVGGVEGDVLEPGDGRDARPRTHRHHDPGRGQLLIPHPQHSRGDETRRLGIHVDAVAAAIVDRAVVKRVDATEDTGPDARPVNSVECGVNAQALALRDRSRRIGGDDQHLRWDAATVKAGAAEAVRLDDSRPHGIQLGPEQHVAAACPDHDQVVGPHCSSSAGHRIIVRLIVTSSMAIGHIYRPRPLTLICRRNTQRQAVWLCHCPAGPGGRAQALMSPKDGSTAPGQPAAFVRSCSGSMTAPFAAAQSHVAARLRRAEFARTWKLLPTQGHDVVIDVQHMVVGVITVVMVGTTLAAALS